MVVFNFYYNLDFFLLLIGKFFYVISDYRFKNIVDQIKLKCQVIYFFLFGELILKFTN